MINVTPAARTRLAEALDNVKDPAAEGACFRLVPQENQLAIALGEPEDGDITVEEEGRTVLALPPQVAKACEGRTLDIEDSGGQSALTLK